MWDEATPQTNKHMRKEGYDIILSRPPAISELRRHGQCVGSIDAKASQFFLKHPQLIEFMSQGIYKIAPNKFLHRGKDDDDIDLIETWREGKQSLARIHIRVCLKCGGKDIQGCSACDLEGVEM